MSLSLTKYLGPYIYWDVVDGSFWKDDGSQKSTSSSKRGCAPKSALAHFLEILLYLFMAPHHGWPLFKLQILKIFLPPKKG